MRERVPIEASFGRKKINALGKLSLLSFSSEHRTLDMNLQLDTLPQWDAAYKPALQQLANEGTSATPWTQLQPMMLGRFAKILRDSDLTALQGNEERIRDILDAFQSYQDTPWSVQRVCELLLQPKSQYNDLSKYLRALEKCVRILSSLSDFPPERHQQYSGLSPFLRDDPLAVLS